MSTLLAFPVWLHRPEFGSRTEDTAAMDWFVLATLATLFFLLGCFATMAWLIWRRTTRPEPHVRLLMELEQEADGTETDEEKPPKEEGQPWERPADWWNK